MAINCLKGIHGLNIPSDNMELAIQYGIIHQYCQQTLDEISKKEQTKNDPDNLSDIALEKELLR